MNDEISSKLSELLTLTLALQKPNTLIENPEVVVSKFCGDIRIVELQKEKGRQMVLSTQKTCDSKGQHCKGEVG